jgi:phosphoribosylformylglycinamidine cyclo-ligase
MITGEAVEAGDTVIALPSSGIHSNGLTLARRALLEEGGRSLDDVPEELGRSLADELLEPTEIYVRAVLELINSPIEVHGLAHITGDGLLNLLRLNDEAGYELDALPAAPPIFALIEAAGGLSPAEMYGEFNMGIGFCCVVPEAEVERTLALLGDHYPAASRIGQVTADAGVIRLPSVGITGRKEGFE